jgi:hypothetical protein
MKSPISDLQSPISLSPPVILWALRELLRNEAAAMRRVQQWSRGSIREMMLTHYRASLVIIAETYRVHNQQRLFDALKQGTARP